MIFLPINHFLGIFLALFDQNFHKHYLIEKLKKKKKKKTVTKKSVLTWFLSNFSIFNLKPHNLIFLPNKIRLNLINTFVMSRNKHISKKTRCFSRKRSKNKAKPNEFERRILKLSCYACSDNPICWHAFSMFRNVSRMNSDLTFYDVYVTIIGDLKIV